MKIQDPNEYVSRTDEAEASRLVDAAGVGDMQYMSSDDIRNALLDDFSIGPVMSDMQAIDDITRRDYG